jgi:hypothetical protein
LFAASGLLMLMWRATLGLPEVTAWLAGAAALMPVGFATGPRVLAIDATGRRVTCGGSPVPLVRNLVIFACQYWIAVALFLYPGERVWLVAARAVSGISIGYFTGWTLMFLKRYRLLRRQFPQKAAPAT